MVDTPPPTSAEVPRVLIIDDEFDVRQITSIALQYEGWMVREASNGREGLAIAREYRPHLILVDLMMPEMTGVEFCRRLTEIPDLRDVSILLISAVSERAKVLNDFWELPLARKNYLHKPFTSDQLVECVKGLVPRFQTGSAPIRPEPAPRPRPAAAPTPPAMPARSAPSEPKKPVMAASPSQAGGLGDHRAGYRVLIVDDDPDIRMILSTALGIYHTVETAENGKLGLAALDRFLPDFIIMDVNMPVMKGPETAEAIRKHPRLRHVPIFFLTAETDKDLPRKLYDVGGNLYLKKPLDPQQLLKFIDFFLKETELEREGNYKKFKDAPPIEQPAAPAAGAPAAPTRAHARAAAPTGGTSVRILTIDASREEQVLLRQLIQGSDGQPPLVGGGPYELIWSDAPRPALANLGDWEPDVILYNPRNPGLDGVAFGQTLKLEHQLDPCQVAFVGTRFYDADHAYSERHFGRKVIDLSMDRQAIARGLEGVLAEAARNPRPKKLSFEALQRQDRDDLRQQAAQQDRLTKERESFRRRYAGIQQFIDRNF